MDTLHFERYEYKYVVPDQHTEAIREFIRPYVVADPHAAKQSKGRYVIYNIYLDTPSLDLFHAGIRGAVDRVKLRIRWYDEAAGGPFFLEVKRKVRQVIVKDRARITRQELDALGRAEPIPTHHDRSSKGAEGFLGRATCLGAAPVVLCKYSREPYESVFGEYARLTFDREICSQGARGFEPVGDPCRWSYLDSPLQMQGLRCATILELKFTNEFPRWMADLVLRFDLKRTGFSKYNSAVIRKMGFGNG